jgi:Uma2 family endonuclease
MATATLPTAKPAERLCTTEDLLAIPDDGIERWLIDGRIVEVGMTIRNKHHTLIQSRINGELEIWLRSQAKPRGTVHAGEAGVRLRKDPELTVGIDLVYLTADVSALVMADEESTIINAVPTLAVEILSPSDTIELIQEKIGIFEATNVSVAWFINPYSRTVAIHRPDRPPVTLNIEDELDGAAELPGFRLPVARLFED